VALLVLTQVLCSAAKSDRASLRRLESEVRQLQQQLHTAEAEREALLLRAQEAEHKGQAALRKARVSKAKGHCLGWSVGTVAMVVQSVMVL
jgi:multidrug efflux pump subunit AcrA (membrane-fusion protein)